MWSAPHQPFVLPVRVRNFEGLYKGEVKTGASVNGQMPELVKEIQAAVSDSLARLKAALVEALKQTNVKYCLVTGEKGESLVGVASGQLFYLIKEIKTPEDMQSEEQLKHVLTKEILGEADWHEVKHDSKVYFAASQERWEKVLGISIHPKKA
jgi:threonyl-tRNA synthetase